LTSLDNIELTNYCIKFDKTLFVDN
jgi:hypothetical protein